MSDIHPNRYQRSPDERNIYQMYEDRGKELTVAKVENEKLRARVKELEEVERSLEELCAFHYGGGVKGYRIAEAWLLRKQAEAVERCKIYGMRVQWSNEAINEYLDKHAQHLRQQADELEVGGGHD